MRYEDEPLEYQKEEGEQEIYVKQLKLITPEWAYRLGLTAESPVFVSPFQTTKKHCSPCNKLFTPLMYTVGEEPIIAQHFHQNRDQGGGIYVYPPKYGKIMKRGAGTGLADETDNCWYADVEPVGKVVIDNSFQARAEGIRVKRIHGLVHGYQVEEGVLVAKMEKDTEGSHFPTTLWIATRYKKKGIEYKWYRQTQLQEYCNFHTYGERIVYSYSPKDKQKE